MEELKQDVKEIRKEIRDVSITLARNTASLEIHIARTNANEDRIAQVEKWMLGGMGAILLALLGYLLR